jgi:ABC-type glutathione transport system ATPase component
MSDSHGSGAVETVEAPAKDRNGDPLLRAEGVWKVFGKNADRVIGTPDADLSRAELREKTGTVVAVRDVSIDVWPGEVFVVMGLSGSGKSTLVRTLIRLIEPTAGAVTICEQDVIAADASELRELRRHRVSMVFQHFGLLRECRSRNASPRPARSSSSWAFTTWRAPSPRSYPAECSSAWGSRAPSRSSPS